MFSEEGPVFAALHFGGKRFRQWLAAWQEEKGQRL